ncbi:MAG: phosphoribosylamine--glycine ligase [Planctomycetota bacterium]
MKVLVLGSGGREHALAWRLARSPRVSQVVSAPGNGGLCQLGDVWTDVPTTGDVGPLVDKATKEKIDFVVVGPEAPLVDGVADRLRKAGIPTFGPNAGASQLEGSKVFTKEFLARHNIPTARYRVVDSPNELAGALEAFPNGVVVKADGLAAGKGVTVTRDLAEAESVARAMLSGSSFGEAGRRVVLEDLLEGVEVTLLTFVSGSSYQLLQSAQDYKPLSEGNQGPNTGGMGAYSPTNLVPDELRTTVISEILEPTLSGLAAEGIEYRGLLYLGLMLTADGAQVLEYNVRFGDPETQPLMMRLRSDPVDLFEAVEAGTLDRYPLQWDPRAAVCVVLASNGYPGKYPTGVPVTGNVHTAVDSDVQVFHAGTRREGEQTVTAGGRVFGVTALGDSVEEARERAYAAAAEVHFDGKIFRTDIAG